MGPLQVLNTFNLSAINFKTVSLGPVRFHSFGNLSAGFSVINFLKPLMINQMTGNCAAVSCAFHDVLPSWNNQADFSSSILDSMTHSS